ncbi:MAG: hypothetical protein ABIR33_12950 [Pyrinomonadaceae bacterium]
MSVQKQIKEFVASQPEPKRDEMRQLHDLILGASPGCKLWFVDGRNAEGRVVSNPILATGPAIIGTPMGRSANSIRSA